MLSPPKQTHSSSGCDNTAIAGKVYETIGQLTSLLAHSEMHRHFTVVDIADILMPPIILDQYRIYTTENGTAIGFVCWGMLSSAAEHKLVRSRDVLDFPDWRSGQQPFVTDFIAQFGHAAVIVKDLKKHIFPDHIVKALRYDSPGNPRPTISRFFGANIKRKTEVA